MTRPGYRSALRSALRSAALKLPPIARLVEQRDRSRAELTKARRRQARLREERDRLRREQELLTAEVAAARASVERTHDYSYLFVVTYGRSGSTLLQGLLNSIPGYLIRGENRSAVYHLFKHYSVSTFQKEHASRGRVLTEQDPWFGMEQYPEKLAIDQMRSLAIDTLIRPTNDCRVIGFKEIRWNQPDLPEYVEFLQLLFPGARFVFNSRNLEDVAKSRWWTKNPDALELLGRVQSRHTELAEQLGDAAYRVHYDDYIADPLVFRGLYDWLGEKFDEAKVRAVLAIPHSYNPQAPGGASGAEPIGERLDQT